MEHLYHLLPDLGVLGAVGIVFLLRGVGKVLRRGVAVVWPEVSCWGLKLLKAFFRTALPAPEALGERIGRWMRSKCGVNDR